MVIHGYYNDIHDNIISVEIYKASGSGDYEIGEFFDNEHHFAFDGRKPVTIKHDSKDLFDPLVSATCKIKLRSNIWCGDMLFSQGIGDIVVKVSRQLNPEKYEGSVSQMIFIGYVKPISFNQNINKHDNVIDINAVDLIGYLKEQYLSTTTSELSDSTSAWKEALANSKYRNFKEMFERAGIINHEFVFSSNTYTTSLYADPIKQNMLNNFYISDNLWLGESKDNEMSFADILTEILKYTNTRLVAVNGLDYYLFENGQATTLNSLDWYHSNTITTIDDVGVATTLPKENIANEQVTMDDCYNIIGVKCELETVDDVVSSPLKEDALTSPYVNQQLYLREYKVDMETEGDLEKFYDFCRLIVNNNFTDVNSDKANFCDWYIRYLENVEWKYNNNMMNTSFLPAMSPKNNTNYIWQNRLSHDLGYVAETSSYTYDDHTWTIKLPTRPYSNLGGAYFIGIGKTKDYDKTDNSPNGNVSLTNYLVIPVKGLARGNSNEQTALDDYASLLQPYNTNPMLSYDSGAVMNLSPSDTQTTNYIIINGKLRCMPVYQSKMDDGRKAGLIPDFSHNYNRARRNADEFLDEHDGRSILVQGPNGTRAYYARFMELETPNQTVNMNSDTDAAPNAAENACMLMFPPQDCDGLYQFQYKYNMVSDHEGTTYDAVTHVPILCCRLYVVNESKTGANRKYVQQDPETFAFSWTDWVTTSDATFCISINPKIDDYIIGPEHDITNTVTASMNLSKSGLAIPIKNTDNVSGKVHFEILGPYNTQYDDVHMRTHSKWTQFWRGEYPQDFSSTPRCLLDRISNIFISKFEMIIDSDHAKNSTLNSGDLLYYSEDTYKYNNPKDIEFKICTALTSEQAATLNVASGVSFNNPTLDNGDLYTTTAAKPEEQYITTMYNRYSTPKKIVEYNCDYDNNKIRDMYCSRYSCTLMNHLNVSPFNSFILSDEMDLKNDRLKIYLREI